MGKGERVSVERTAAAQRARFQAAEQRGQVSGQTIAQGPLIRALAGESKAAFPSKSRGTRKTNTAINDRQ